MFIQQMYTGCISEAAYYIESDGEVAIIDPLRDIEAYLELAAQRKATIKYIFETHFHADFVSGHLDLSAATGAKIIFGPNTVTNLPVHVAEDGARFALGKLTIQVLHTPGHTLESTCFLLLDEADKQHAIFTGDTLFIGDVGRPDLAQTSLNLSPAELAAMLYESLQQKIVPLDDAVMLYPAHGAGSSCGKKLSDETHSTIGEQKLTNYALLQPSKEAFIQAVTAGLTEPPPYFAVNAKINKEGYQSMEEIYKNALQPLSVTDFKVKAQQDDVVILDTRNASDFTNGYIPSSIFIGLEGRFAEWAGNLLSFNKTIILVCENGKEKESVIRLARVGLEKIAGYLAGGYAAWVAAGEQIDLIIDIEADELAMDIPFDENLVIVDVRKELEFANEHIADAVNIPLLELIDPASMVNLDDIHNIYVHCGGGYRSVIAASLIKRQGIHNIRNVLGGWNAIKELGDKFKFEKSEEVLN